MAIQFQANSFQELVADAEKTFPDECCGFMAGKEDGEERIITAILPVINSKEGDKKRRYLVSPMDYMKAEQWAEDNNLQLLGIYHSHPNHPSVPSEHDRVAAQPYFSYVIASIMDGAFANIQSWRLNDDFQFEEETITN
ncbi:M67 family metallopeptidase [Aridibaculum aurantiacum]|uniref:M67 family metallopeptidase n=1 Tax=Aridibaculum aurantiacum TaxID=2810307 RepID=UPI001A964AA9|nr:M67 family metallopeptidase [Aridibaculum aurantiacum]